MSDSLQSAAPPSFQEQLTPVRQSFNTQANNDVGRNPTLNELNPLQSMLVEQKSTDIGTKYYKLKYQIRFASP